MCRVARWNGQPRSFLAESGICVGVPLHGSAFAVAADFLWPSGAADGIFHIFFALGVVVLHADLFAVIHDRSAPKGEIEGAHEFRDGVVIFSVTITVVRTDLVMVANHIDRPTARLINSSDLSAKLRR